MIWNLDNLIRHCGENRAKINNKWVPARPLNYKYRTFKQKIIEAYKVFKGELDSFKWPGNQ